MKQFILLLFFLTSFTTLAQQADVVDFKRIEATLQADPSKKEIHGQVSIHFTMKKATDSVYIDAHDFIIDSLQLSGPKLYSEKDRIWFVDSFDAGKDYQVNFSYHASPGQTLYFTGDQIWTQGQGKYTSHWLPSIDDMNDKIEFDLTIRAGSEKRVITNGALQSLIMREGESEIDWKFNMNHPMSSYLAAMVIGDFSKKTIASESGIPIELYFRPGDSVKFEPTYRYTKEIFDFLEAEIGVPYPWQNYKQVPVRDFLYAGMENTTATVFSEAFVVDSIGFNDRNYVNVNAHELAHHWFGNLVTETSGAHHWLQEGFATYYAHLAEKEVFGDDYFYWVMYQSAEQLKELSDQGKGESLLNPKASSLTFYEKGAWALHILRERIGDQAFNTAIRNYLQKYKFKNVSTEDFLAEVRAASTTDISDWEQDWLQQTAFKATQAFNSLSRSEFMNRYFEISALRATPLSEKTEQLSEAIEIGNDFIGQEAVYQLAGENPLLSHFLYEKALASDNLYVRQAVAVSMDGVSERLRPAFEKLLNDPSYVTIEAALYGLWASFPADRKRYLDTTENIVGFQDKNVRQLWLALAIITPDYGMEHKTDYVDELLNYAGRKYSFEIRQKAFEYLAELQLISDRLIDELVDASVHHNWRFRSSARTLLEAMAESAEVRDLIVSGLSGYSEEEQRYLKSKILDE